MRIFAWDNWLPGQAVPDAALLVRYGKKGVWASKKIGQIPEAVSGDYPMCF
jgi:hypothetical protein